MPNDKIGYVILEGLDIEPNAKILDKDKHGKVVGFATFQEAEKENRNGRSYLASDLLREIQCPRTKELLKSNTFYSEWCHPQGDMVRQQTIDPKCAVARILSLEMNGNLVQGTFTPINTPICTAYGICNINIPIIHKVPKITASKHCIVKKFANVFLVSLAIPSIFLTFSFFTYANNIFVNCFCNFSLLINMYIANIIAITVVDIALTKLPTNEIDDVINPVAIFIIS